MANDDFRALLQRYYEARVQELESDLQALLSADPEDGMNAIREALDGPTNDNPLIAAFADKVAPPDVDGPVIEGIGKVSREHALEFLSRYNGPLSPPQPGTPELVEGALEEAEQAWREELARQRSANRDQHSEALTHAVASRSR